MPFVKFDSVDSMIRGFNQRVSNWVFSVSSYILVLKYTVFRWYLSIDKCQGERGSVFLVGSRDQFPTSDAFEETSDKVEVTVPRGQVEQGVVVSLVHPAEVFLP